MILIYTQSTITQDEKISHHFLSYQYVIFICYTSSCANADEWGEQNISKKTFVELLSNLYSEMKEYNVKLITKWTQTQMMGYDFKDHDDTMKQYSSQSIYTIHQLIDHQLKISSFGGIIKSMAPIDKGEYTIYLENYSLRETLKLLNFS